MARKKIKSNKNEEEEHSHKISTIVKTDEKLLKFKEEKKRKISSEKRRNSVEDVETVEMRKSKSENKKRQRKKVVDAVIDVPSDEKENTEAKKEVEGEVDEQIVTPKKANKKKRKSDKIGEADEINNEVQQQKGVTVVETKRSKLKKKKRQMEKVIDAEIDQPSEEKEITEIEGEADEQILTPKKAKKKKRKNVKIGEVEEVKSEVQQQKGKSKKARKAEKKDQMLPNNDEKENVRAEEVYEVYEMSSGDEDSSEGMTKWVSEYHKSRLGLDILQQRIDDFIIDHEEKEEQAKKEKEARMAEDGWTFVGPQKGRKKTTDSDGVVVGSVSEAAARDKFSQKETKHVGSDFYRFQKREAHRNEIMKLQSKFEEDKKRIQQMRANRKFRPY